MNKIRALFAFICSIPKGLLMRVSGRNRYKINFDPDAESYRCKPDNVAIHTQSNKRGVQKTDDDVDCPDTMYPMW